MASRRLIWPLIIFANVGELESETNGEQKRLIESEQRTFKVGHESLGSAVESVDYHFAVSRTSDFDATVLKTRSRGCTVP